MYGGEIIEQGPAEEILNNPKHPKTIEYVNGVIS
jgi:ABC-type dipeptide/oligopeptide/nickel transport system ATPase component